VGVRASAAGEGDASLQAEGGIRFSLSQRERAGVRENAWNSSTGFQRQMA
jgi:hypothetical protein